MYLKESNNIYFLLSVTTVYLSPFCQNPNLTTTQPQPNLNLVGFDTIITLHHPTHPTTTGTLLLPEIMILGV